MILRVNQVVFGLGRCVLGASPNRMGVWTQGCSLAKCLGCSSTHAWSADGGKTVSVESLLKLARLRTPSGLTISGGEPTDQAQGVATLIIGFRETFPGAEVVLYTGLGWAVLAKRFPELAALPDVVIAGPYVRGLEATALAGSSNQEVKLLTPLAESLYQGWRAWPRHLLQIGGSDEGRIVTVGIPHTSRMTQAARRVNATEVSWDLSRRRRR